MIIVYLFESTYDSTRNYLSETSRLPWRIYSMVSIRLEFLVCTALPVYLAPPGKFSYLHVAGKTVSLVAGLNVSRWVACICLQRKKTPLNWERSGCIYRPTSHTSYSYVQWANELPCSQTELLAIRAGHVPTFSRRFVIGKFQPSIKKKKNSVSR